jgi:hypothetical protein
MKNLFAQSLALYERLRERSLYYPPDDPMFIRISRVMQKVARRCYRRHMTASEREE